MQNRPNRPFSYTGLGLIIGAALGIIIAGFGGMIWIGGAGAGIGLVIGAAIDASIARKNSDSTPHHSDDRKGAR